jgi:hypothetical protein
MNSSLANRFSPVVSTIPIGPAPGTREAVPFNQRVGHRPVSMITQRQIKPGCQSLFSNALEEFVAFARRFPGHRDIRVLTRIKDGREFCAVVDRFANSAARCAFTSSPDFGRWLRVLQATTLEISDLREAETTQTAYPLGNARVARMVKPRGQDPTTRWLRLLIFLSSRTLRRLQRWLFARRRRPIRP